jgi:hypothetical protein
MTDDLIAKILSTAPKERPVFAIGQTVRVLSKIDVNFPKELDYWLNSKCKVVDIIPRGFIGRDWSYELIHENGKTCEFRKEELDLRYRLR